MELQVTLDGDPPEGAIVRLGDGHSLPFVGWSGLLRAVTEIAGEGSGNDESP